MGTHLRTHWSGLFCSECVHFDVNLLAHSSQAGEDTAQIEEALQMLLALQRKAEDRVQLAHITGFPGDLEQLGAILRHVSIRATLRRHNLMGWVEEGAANM